MDITIFVLMGCVVCFCIVLMITVYRLESQVREMKEILNIIAEFDHKVSGHNKEIIDRCIDVVERDKDIADKCVDLIKKIDNLNNRVIEHFTSEE